MDQFLKYFNNELSKKGHEKMTKELLEAHYDASIKEKWKKKLEEDHNVLPSLKISSSKTKRVNRYWKLSLVAASVLLFVLVGKQNLFISNEINPDKNIQQLLQTYMAEKYDHPNLKKGPRKDEIRTKATNAYSVGDYKTAITYYSQLPVLKSEDFIFNGLSFLYDHQAGKAIPLLQESISRIPFEGFRVPEEIRWQLSLAYLENGQFDEAKIELERLSKNKSGKRHKHANSILKVLQ